MRFFILFLAAFTFVSAHAATTVSLLETDLTKVEAAINDPKDAYSKLIAVCAKNCIINNYRNFDDLYQMVRKECQVLSQGNEYYTPELIEKRAALIAKCLVHNRPHLHRGAFDLTKKYPDAYDLGMYMLFKDHGQSDLDLYNTILMYLVKYHNVLHNDLATKAVTRLIDLGASSDEIKTQKQDLQKLNRIYSPKVLKDKDKWEPLCSQVRTAMETY